MTPPTFAAAPDLALQAYGANGFHAEPDVIGRDLCDELVRTAGDFPESRGGDFRTVLQPHRRSAVFLETLRSREVSRIMRMILGPDIAGIQTQFFHCRPGTPGFQPHQDNRFVNAPPGAFASAWLALTEVSPHNGGLMVYPGSQREPLLDVVEVDFQETMLQDTNAMRLRCLVPEQYQPLDVRLGKGGALFLDGHTVHASHANVSDRPRYALLMTYVRKGASFTAGRYAQREAVAIE